VVQSLIVNKNQRRIRAKSKYVVRSFMFTLFKQLLCSSDLYNLKMVTTNPTFNKLYFITTNLCVLHYFEIRHICVSYDDNITRRKQFLILLYITTPKNSFTSKIVLLELKLRIVVLKM